MNRYHNKNKNSQPASASVSNAGAYGKMSTRRQLEHESGYYEDITDDCYGYNSNVNSSVGAGKRQRQLSNEAVYGVDKKYKSQVTLPVMSGNKKKNTSSTSASFGVGGNMTKKNRNLPENNRANNVASNGSVNKTATTYHTQNLCTKKNNPIKSNNNNNNNTNSSINKEVKLKNASSMNTKICLSSTNYNDYSNNNNNNNNYGIQSEKSYHTNDLLKNMTTIDLNEVVEVPDSDSEEEDRSSRPCRKGECPMYIVNNVAPKHQMSKASEYVAYSVFCSISGGA